ncbi:MAG: hypothetical protein E7162_00755 [Firmicutes bacterium]|nr:hypothetical protein [Bacillota bacterium]
MLSREELNKRMTEYLLKYREGYGRVSEIEDLEYEMDLMTYIKYYYADSYYEPRRGENAFFQMFSAIDGLEGRDPYFQTMQEIEQEFGLDRDIVEVGCGMFPSLARIIAKRQQEIGKGTITAYDPELVTKVVDGVNLVRGHFTLTTPIPKNALIIGRKPCEATEVMIKSASKNNAELFLKLCDCNHIPDKIQINYQDSFRKNWFKYIDELAIATLQPGFEIEKSESIDTLVGDKDLIIKIKKLTR